MLRATVALILISVLLGGCLRSGSGQGNAGAESQRSGEAVSLAVAHDALAHHAESIRAKAEAFAQAELARMNAAEMMYRNKVTLHEITIPASGNISRVKVKMYREFTGYEVVDIYRSDSVLAPIVYEIKYQYNLYSTPARNSANKVEYELAEHDTKFFLDGQYAITRRYPCAPNGEYAGTLPPLPPRPDFFAKGADPEAGEVGSYVRKYFENNPSGVAPGQVLPF